jgi:hypothetical protein
MLDVYMKGCLLCRGKSSQKAELSLVLADETQLDILDRLEESEGCLRELIFRIGQSRLSFI